MKRCDWVPLDDPLYVEYHDSEWGTPLHDDGKLFELLLLEGAQAGLSWKTILHKRENYRKAFDCFDPMKMSGYDDRRISELMLDAGIVRNRRKIEAFVGNAVAYPAVVEEYGSFDRYIWSFVDYRQTDNHRKSISEVPSKTDSSDAMSKGLKKRGFRFTGSTICYAFMQAAGLVNDHTTDCFRYSEVKATGNHG